jgi:hypothetical protein
VDNYGASQTSYYYQMWTQNTPTITNFVSDMYDIKKMTFSVDSTTHIHYTYVLRSSQSATSLVKYQIAYEDGTAHVVADSITK